MWLLIITIFWKVGSEKSRCRKSRCRKVGSQNVPTHIPSYRAYYSKEFFHQSSVYSIYKLGMRRMTCWRAQYLQKPGQDSNPQSVISETSFSWTQESNRQTGSFPYSLPYGIYGDKTCCLTHSKSAEKNRATSLHCFCGFQLDTLQEHHCPQMNGMIFRVSKSKHIYQKVIKVLSFHFLQAWTFYRKKETIRHGNINVWFPFKFCTHWNWKVRSSHFEIKVLVAIAAMRAMLQ